MEYREGDKVVIRRYGVNLGNSVAIIRGIRESCDSESNDDRVLLCESEIDHQKTEVFFGRTVRKKKLFTGYIPLDACATIEIEAENEQEALVLLRKMVREGQVDLGHFDHGGEYSFFVEEELEK